MITITDTATVQFKEILRSQQMEESGIRVFVRGQCGCGKVHYGMGFDNNSGETDQVIDKDGVKFFIEKEVAEGLDGATIDYTETEMSRGFAIDNPNAQGCNCGGH